MNLPARGVRGPGVLSKSRSLSPNALRGTMLTEPESALPGESGVADCTTSTRDTLLIDTVSRATARPIPPTPALARSKPATVIGTLPAGAPLIMMFRALPPPYSMATPGRNLIISAALASATWPNSSDDTSVLISEAKRCSWIATAAPSMLRDVTTKLSSLTTGSPPGVAAAPCSNDPIWIVCSTVPFGGTVTLVTLAGSPVRKARIFAGPAGTPCSRKLPSSSVKVSSAEPSRVSWTRSR
jgi:hypothetical protein